MLNTVCQKKHMPKIKCYRNVNMIYQVTQRKSWNIKKLRRKVNMLQCPSSLKQINFKMECFSSLSDKPSIYYKYRGDLVQHSVVNQNNETQSWNSRAVALSTHARLRFNSSMSSLLGAFDLFLSRVSLLGFLSLYSAYPFQAGLWYFLLLI